MSDAALQSLARFWETLTRESVASLERVYTEETHFRDPFNDVRGAAALQRVLTHMFDTLDEPRFTIRETVREGANAFLVWDFDFRVKAWKPATPRRIHGSSHIRFAPDGRVTYHRDYWDAAGELYAHLPLIGPVVRWLGGRLGDKWGQTPIKLIPASAGSTRINSIGV